MSPSRQSIAKARQTIFAQEMIPLLIKRTAWVLFRHELTRKDPRTRKPFTRRRALSNTLKWMEMQKDRQVSGLRQLSPMQKKIIEMLVQEGLSQKQIAYEMERSPETIKHHCERIRRKVGVNSMYQVVAIAVDLGWVTAPHMQDPNGQ